MLKIDLSKFDTATLLDMKKEIEKELSNRNTQESETSFFISYDKNFITLKTVKNYSIKAAGKPYIAKLSVNEEKIEREFISPKFMNIRNGIAEAKWIINPKNGDVIEARLSDGRWGREIKSYFIVKNGKLKKLESFEHAKNILRKRERSG